jgi:hypothetical protein
MAKERELSAVAKEVFKALQSFPNGATLADIKKVVPNANSAHLVALKSRGLVNAEKVEIETERIVKSKVNSYSVIETDETDESESDDE